ncbi:MAG: PEP-CTERM sorting domain-containing protein [Spirulinaceae cyanobacterium RM2_2_10]|nr:PEP-CTERM sorting domain-containing protein [Spirulinaceae cyanobacterium SM2_1_0]NJO19841.1 PEP-CTERM sorting domain-containing protein [Spirulinaceae cyanobacterium RM2_2_10]
MNSRLFAGFTTAAAMTSALVLAGTAQAATISFSDSLALSTTDIIDEVLSVQQFDSSLGTLTQVTLAFTGLVQGDARIESLDSQATTVTFNVGGSLTLLDGSDTLPNPLFDVEVTSADSADVSAFDGVIDFAGTSGASFMGLEASTDGEQVYTDAALLSFFTGNGDLSFLFSAIANSQVTGAGNIASQISTLASAGITVTYEYDEIITESVPEPSTLLGLGAVLAAGAMTLRKRGNVLSK